MSRLLDYVVYVLIAVAIWASLLFAWHFFVIAPAEARGHAAGQAEQLAKDTPVISRLTRERDGALAANKSLTGDVGVLKDAVADAGRQIGALVAAGDASRAAAKAAMARVEASAKAAAAESARLAAIVDRKPSTDPCGGACARALDLLRSLVADSVL